MAEKTFFRRFQSFVTGWAISVAPLLEHSQPELPDAQTPNSALVSTEGEKPISYISLVEKPNALAALGKIEFTDQYGQKYDTAQLKGKPFAFGFTFNECTRCATYRPNIAAIQKALKASGNENVPIVMVTIHPEDDRGNMKEFIERSYHAGLVQTKGETAPATTEARDARYEELRKTPQGERVLHVLAAGNAKQVQQLQRDLQLRFNAADPDSHSFMFSVVNGDGAVVEQVKTDVQGEAQQNEIARRVVAAVDKARGRTP